MIFNCREKEGTAPQGTGRGGGAAGTSQVDTFVKSVRFYSNHYDFFLDK